MYWGDMLNVSYTEGSFRWIGNTLEEQRKHFAQYILYIMDAPYKDNFNNPVYSYYYDLQLGTDSNNASNAWVIDQMKEDFELVGEDRDKDTILIALVNMNNPTAILDEVYNNCDVLLLNWQVARDSNIMFDTLHYAGYELVKIDGKLPTSLYSSNTDVILDSAIGSVVPDGAANEWKKSGFGLTYDENLDRNKWTDNKGFTIVDGKVVWD
jgi:hypothetical protein